MTNPQTTNDEEYQTKLMSVSKDGRQKTEALELLNQIQEIVNAGTHIS